MILSTSRKLRASASWRLCVVGLAAVAAAQDAYAAPVCSSGPIPAVFTATLPGGAYIVSPNATVGTLLSPWTAWQEPGYSWVCSAGNLATAAAAQAAFTGPVIRVGQLNYMAFPTTLPGVGVVVDISSHGSVGYPVGRYTAPLTDVWQATSWFQDASSGGGSQRYGMATRYAFVKTGPMTSGTASASGQIARVGMGRNPPGDVAYIGYVNIAGSAAFSVPTCTTPDVTVDLGQHRDSEFPSVGSRRGASGSFSDFLIDLNQCYRNASSLSYSMHPLNGAVAGMPGLMNISPTSSARGVGIRIMEDSGSFLSFDTKTPVIFANNSFYMHLSAAIERTDWNAFAGGSVAGYIEFTIFYD